MISVLIHLLVFITGCIACDLVRFAQERHRLRQVTRAAVHMAGSADIALDSPVDMACQEWSINPAYWCNRPGCSRCWGWWGLS